MRWKLLLPLLAAGAVAAAPIDFTTGITTGSYISTPSFTLTDGAMLSTFPVWTFLENNRTYGAQLVLTGSDEKSESFVAIGGNRQFGFSSAVSTGAGALEVGVDNPLRTRGGYISFARYYTTIKNNTEGELDFDFYFVVEPGELTLRGIRDGDTAHLRAGGFIDYRLLSPAGPFGGTYDETNGRLYDYYADIDFDDRITGSRLVASSFYNDQSLLSLRTEKLADHVSLPTIPGYGELTIYYDMYAHLNVRDGEVGGTVMLGDPVDLVGGSGGYFVERAAAVGAPEPGTLLLLLGGLAGLGASRLRLRRNCGDARGRSRWGLRLWRAR